MNLKPISYFFWCLYDLFLSRWDSLKSYSKIMCYIALDDPKKKGEYEKVLRIPLKSIFNVVTRPHRRLSQGIGWPLGGWGTCLHRIFCNLNQSQLITIPSISDQPVPGRSPLELLAAEQFLPGEREFQLVKPYVKYVVAVRVLISEATQKIGKI